ncbi:hypothetical protein FRB95_009743 [Tulasnella sp. JGI-2019a]|nr:hypothetical protein FRB95_009743 [Tulasnella sp. JGI-2019a]
MSRLIGERFARLKGHISYQQTPTLEETGRLWIELAESLDAAPEAIWPDVLKYDLIPEMLELLPKTIQLDIKGEAPPIAIQTLNTCLYAGWQTFKSGGHISSKGVETLKLGADHACVTSIIKQWWITVRHLTPGWIRNGELERACQHFLAFVQFGANIVIPGVVDNINYLRQMATSCNEIQDFSLVFGVFARYDDEPAFSIGPAFAFSTLVSNDTPVSITDQWKASALLEEYPNALVQRLEEALRSQEKAFPMIVVLRSIEWLQRYPQFNKLLIRGDLPCQIASAYWRSCRRGSLEVKNLVPSIFDKICSLTTNTHIARPSVGHEQMARLLSTKCDVLGIIERVMLDGIRISDPLYSSSSVWSMIGTWFSIAPEKLRVPMRRDYLQILDHLRDLPQTPYIVVVRNFWEGLGMVAKLSEQELRAELTRPQMEDMEDIVGCSWVKCPMYEQDFAVETYRCAGCRSKIYCTLICQKRDWEEGGHRMQCHALANAG